MLLLNAHTARWWAFVSKQPSITVCLVQSPARDHCAKAMLIASAAFSERVNKILNRRSGTGDLTCKALAMAI